MVPSGGGPNQKVIDGFFRGDWIRQPAGHGSWIVTSDGDRVLRLIDVDRKMVVWETSLPSIPGGSASTPMFSPDGRSISAPFPETRDHFAIQVFETSTGKSRLAVRLPFNISFRASWVNNGDALIVNRQDTVSHVVMFDRFWAPSH